MIVVVVIISQPGWDQLVQKLDKLVPGREHAARAASAAGSGRVRQSRFSRLCRALLSAQTRTTTFPRLLFSSNRDLKATGHCSMPS
jgi:hypothetical protein